MSGLAVPPNTRSSSGTNSVRISRARWLRVAAHAAVMPAAHHRRDPRRIGEAEPRQRRQRLRIVFGAGEHQIARSGEARRFLEQLGVMPLDRAETRAQLGDERLGIRIAEKCREPGDPGGVAGQPMGLRVLDHLQPVLDATQETVVVDQRVGRGLIDLADGDEPAQRRAGRADPQFAQSAAPDQLLRLREELDLANAAAAGLDVVPLDRDSAAALVRLDLALDRMDVLDRREIEVLAPNERL